MFLFHFNVRVHPDGKICLKERFWDDSNWSHSKSTPMIQKIIKNEG